MPAVEIKLQPCEAEALLPWEAGGDATVAEWNERQLNAEVAQSKIREALRAARASEPAQPVHQKQTSLG